MKKIVIDTNLFVSSVILKRGLPDKLIQGWKNREYILLTSYEIINEIERVLNYPRIKKKYKLSKSVINELINLLEIESVVLSGNIQINAVKDDPDDNKFLAVAIEGNADYIISGDAHLLKLANYKNIPIISVREFFVRNS